MHDKEQNSGWLSNDPVPRACVEPRSFSVSFSHSWLLVQVEGRKLAVVVEIILLPVPKKSLCVVESLLVFRLALPGTTRPFSVPTLKALMSPRLVFWSHVLVV